DLSADHAREPLLVGPPVDHEHRQGFGGVERDVLAVRAGTGDILAGAGQSTVQRVTMRRRRDDDGALAGVERRPNMAADCVDEEIVVLVELNDVVASPARSMPVPEGLCD